jgi:hypothetical protein
MPDRAALSLLMGATGLFVATSGLLAATSRPCTCRPCTAEAVGRRVEGRIDRLEAVVREAVDDLGVQVQDVRDAVRRCPGGPARGGGQLSGPENTG